MWVEGPVVREVHVIVDPLAEGYEVMGMVVVVVLTVLVMIVMMMMMAMMRMMVVVMRMRMGIVLFDVYLDMGWDWQRGGKCTGDGQKQSQGCNSSACVAHVRSFIPIVWFGSKRRGKKKNQID